MKTCYDAWCECLDIKYGSPLTWLKLKSGDRIHLHSKKGTYTVNHVTKNKICITCRSWNYEKQYVPNTDFKCMYGGKTLKNLR